jgi:hypothetical protein
MIETIDFLYSDWFGYALFLFPVVLFLTLVVFDFIDRIVNLFRGRNRRLR